MTPTREGIPTPLTERAIEIAEPLVAGARWFSICEHARQLERDRAALLAAAREALSLIEHGKPGWGVAKDLLRGAISEAEKNAA